MMSQELRDVLQAAGWSPDRAVPIEPWAGQLAELGVSVVPAAEAIWRNFGGLTIEPVRRPGDPIATETVVFDPLGTFDEEDAAYWQEHLGQKLTPIGEVGGQACLWVAETGEVYRTWDRYLFREGDSLEDALDNTLVFGRRRSVELARMQ